MKKTSEYCKRWRDKNKAKVSEMNRAYSLRRFYKMTVEQFEQLLASQGNRCAICETTDPGPKNFHVDHDHKTDRIRGILCNNCNRGIGYLKDSAEVLQKAVEYLKE